MAQKNTRRHWSKEEKKQLVSRMDELLKRPGMTVLAAASMLDITDALYRSWKYGRGRSGQRSQPPIEAAIVTLPKAAKVAPQPSEVSYTVTILPGNRVRLECSLEHFSQVLDMVAISLPAEN